MEIIIYGTINSVSLALYALGNRTGRTGHIQQLHGGACAQRCH